MSKREMHTKRRLQSNNLLISSSVSSSDALGLFPYPSPFSCFCLAFKTSRHLASCGPLLTFRLEFFCLRYRPKLHKNPPNVVSSCSDPSFFSYGQQKCAAFFIQGLGRKIFDFGFFSGLHQICPEQVHIRCSFFL
jgi:hypothetical protein